MDITNILKLLQWLNATASGIIQARAAARDIVNALKQSKVLTPEQSAQLDAEAEALFADPASQPSGR